MYKYLLALLFFIIVGVGVWSFKNKTSHTVQANTLANLDASNIKKSTHITQETQKKTTIKPTTEAQSSVKQESLEESILYESLSLDEAKLNTAPRKNITPLGAIRITQNISTLETGDTLTLPNIEGEDYTLSVKSTHTNPDGSTSTTAQYEDEGITYTSTITQSPTSNYINLATANGLYEVEASNDIGYIYKTNTIRKQMQDTSTNDFTILPIPTQKSR